MRAQNDIWDAAAISIFEGAAPQPSHRLYANSTGSRCGLLCTVMPQSAARFLYHLQFLLGLAGCTALRLRSKDELAGTTRHRRFSAHRCLCARLIVGLTVNGSQYVCALPQCDTMQCYHTVRPRDYHQSQTSLTVCMYCRWSECSAARHTATEF